MRLIPVALLLVLVTACSFEPEGVTETEITSTFSQIYIPEETMVYTDFLTRKPADGTYNASFGDGSPRAEITFEKGYAAEGTIWDRNGDVKLTYAKEGDKYTRTRYHANGNKAQTVTFKDGIMGIGEFKSWYEDGHPETESTAEVIRNWYPGGQLESEVNIRDDELHGRSTMWHENGQIAGESFYNEGELDGPYQEWDEEGNLVSEKEYKLGELISESL